MTHDVPSLMLALQYGDSFFPSGATAFSWGLEGLAEQGFLPDAVAVEDFVVGQLHARWAGYDRVIVIASHRAHRDLNAVREIDNEVEVRTAAQELRQASCRMGGAMLAVFQKLGQAEADQYRGLVKCGEAYGHLPVMQGFLWATVGLSEEQALALSAHGFCVGLLGAAIRLGCLTHVAAQRILRRVREIAATIAEQPVPPLAEIASFAIEAEITIVRHAERDMRLFAN